MVLWNSDAEMFSLMRRQLYTAVVGDILDQMGYVHQFLPSRIMPMRDDMIVAGRAMTVLEADTVQGDASGRSEQMRRSFGLMLEALDDLKENEVYLCSGSSPRYAPVGELMCTRMQKLGAAGDVYKRQAT